MNITLDYAEVRREFYERVSRDLRSAGEALGQSEDRIQKVIECAMDDVDMGIQGMKRCSLVFVKHDGNEHPEGCACSVLAALMIGIVPYAEAIEHNGNVSGLAYRVNIEELTAHAIMFTSHLSNHNIAILPKPPMMAWAVGDPDMAQGA